jgi:hypothetical protein
MEVSVGCVNIIEDTTRESKVKVQGGGEVK